MPIHWLMCAERSSLMLCFWVSVKEFNTHLVLSTPRPSRLKQSRKKPWSYTRLRALSCRCTRYPLTCAVLVDNPSAIALRTWSRNVHLSAKFRKSWTTLHISSAHNQPKTVCPLLLILSSCWERAVHHFTNLLQMTETEDLRHIDLASLETSGQSDD